MPSFGHNSYIGFSRETTHGTYVAATNFLRILNESVKPAYGRVAKPSLGSVGVRQHHAMREAVDGSISFQVPVAGIGLLLESAIGDNTTTGAGPYAHTMETGTSELKSLSFFVDRDSLGTGGGSSAYRYSGVNINSLTLTQNGDDFLQCNIDILGQKQALAATESATFPQNSGATADADLFRFDQCVVSLDGTAVSVTDFELSIENNLSADGYFLGTTTRHAHHRSGNRIIKGKCTMELDATNFAGSYTDWLNGTGVSFSVVWTSGSEILSVTAEGSRTYIQAAAPSASEAGVIMLPVEFEIMEDPTDTYKHLKCVLTNYESAI